jgi:hypothetical protein
MGSRTLTRFRLAALAVITSSAILVASPPMARAESDRTDSLNRTLAGTWWVHVTAFTDCTSRTPLATFSALLTFATGGTMTGATTNPAFAIGQRGPDHGVWFRSRGAHTYHASSVALVLFTTAPNFPVTPGFQAGSHRIDQTIELTDSDHFNSEAVTQFFDASGNKYREGCAAATGQRFE